MHDLFCTWFLSFSVMFSSSPHVVPHVFLILILAILMGVKQCLIGFDLRISVCIWFLFVTHSSETS